MSATPAPQASRRPTTHPFLQDERLFAHNGVMQGLTELDSRLERLGAAGQVEGQTDSERVFALITAEITRHRGDGPVSNDHVKTGVSGRPAA
jgi:predicted glutamine amidotransferase